MGDDRLIEKVFGALSSLFIWKVRCSLGQPWAHVSLPHFQTPQVRFSPPGCSGPIFQSSFHTPAVGKIVKKRTFLHQRKWFWTSGNLFFYLFSHLQCLIQILSFFSAASASCESQKNRWSSQKLRLPRGLAAELYSPSWFVWPLRKFSENIKKETP